MNMNESPKATKLRRSCSRKEMKPEHLEDLSPQRFDSERVYSFGFRGLGFRGLGFRVSGFGFRVSGLGFRVWGLGWGVWGWGLLENEVRGNDSDLMLHAQLL